MKKEIKKRTEKYRKLVKQFSLANISETALVAYTI